MPADVLPVRAPRAGDWLWGGALLAVMAGYAWATYVVRFYLLVPVADTWVHLALIRRTLEHGWFPGEAFYADLGTPPYYSLAHVILAGVCAMTGLRPHELWTMAPPIVALGTVAATFAWLQALTRDLRLAVIGAAVEMLVVAPYDPAWTVMLYPRGFALAPRALALFCYVRGRQSGQLSLIVAAGVMLGVCLDTHLFMGGFTLLSVMFVELALRRTPAKVSRSWLPVLITVAGGLLVGSPWIVNTFNRWRERETLVRNLFDVTMPLFNREVWSLPFGSHRLAMYRPSAVFNALPEALWPVVGLGLIVALWRWWIGRATLADRYALAATGGTLMLLLTPLFGALVLVGGVWTGRLVQVVPLALLAALGCTGIADVMPRFAPGPRQLAQALTVLGITGYLGWSAATTVYAEVATRAIPQAYFRNGPLGDWDLEDKLARFGPLPRVVLTDPNTSYLLPYYLGCRVIAIPASHGSAYIDHAARDQDVRRVYRRRTPARDLLNILDAYQVDTVIVRPPHPWEYFWADPAVYDELRQRLRTLPNLFEDTGCCGYVAVFHYLPQYDRIAAGEE